MKCIEEGYYIDLEWTSEKELIYSKLKINTCRLSDIIQFSRGIKTSDDSRFISNVAKNKDYKKIYRGKNIKAYQLNWNNEYVWYRPDLMREKVGCLPHSKEFFEVPQKLITQRVNSSSQLLVAYDDEKQYFLDTTNVSRYDTWDKKHSMKFICGILNSKLINYWYCNKYKMPTIGGYELHSIPFKRIDFENSKSRLIHDTIETLVEQLIHTKKELGDAVLDKKIDYLDKKCLSLTRQIDNVIYELYGLTDDEIKIVEGE